MLDGAIECCEVVLSFVSFDYRYVRFSIGGCQCSYVQVWMLFYWALSLFWHRAARKRGATSAPPSSTPLWGTTGGHRGHLLLNAAGLREVVALQQWNGMESNVM